MNTVNKEEQIPALAIKLQGRNLIEASAGTGKTWTLTGILLRLLLEANFQPRQICATTFTRKAASEMRERVEKKMQSLLALARFLAQQKAEDLEFWEDDENFKIRLENQLAIWANNSEKLIAEAAADEIVKHLFLNAAEKGLSFFTDFLRTCDNCEKSLSDMFIGTFDSLCQKWLGEFALETGSSNTETLLEDELYPIQNIVNNGLRKYYSIIEDKKYDLELLINLEKSANDFSTAIKNNLSFFKSDFYDLSLNSKENLSEKLKKYENKIENLNFKGLEKIPANSFEKYRTFINGNSYGFFKNILFVGDNFSTFLQALSQKIIISFDKNPNDNKVKQEKIYAFFKNPELIFKKNYTNLGEEISNLDFFSLLKDCFLNLYEYKLLKEQKSNEVSYELAKTNWQLVKNELPNYLERNGKTIFSEQIAKLNRTLENNQNLAQFIARHYPVMLVDESQDLNAQQTELLKKIYIDCNPDEGFFMPVGDPKQAIYLFRGGDVYNYNFLKTFFAKENTFSLNKSYRTTKVLIDKFNLLYQETINNKKPYFGKNIYYELMTAANNQAEIFENQKELKHPLISFSSKDKEAEWIFIADLVANLLSKRSRFHRKENNQNTVLKASDILILSKTNEQLEKIREQLNQKNIEVEISIKDDYLFSHEIPRILEFLFSGFLEPHNAEYTNALMLSVFFNAKLEEQNLRDNLTKALVEAGRIWQQRGLSAAFNYFCSEMKIWQRLATYQDKKMRYLLDLRLINQILPNFERQLLPQEVLEKWREFLINPTLAAYKADEIENENCVRLMTLHGSKGLEAPIVIVAGLSNSKNNFNKEIFKSYFDENSQKRVIYTPEAGKEIAEQGEVQSEEEQARLLYVALTRARELLFIAQRNEKGLKVLDSLNIKDKTININNADEILLEEEFLKSPNLEENFNENKIFKEDKNKTNFIGWKKSSFTSLVSNSQEANLAIDSKDFEIENPEDIKPELEEESLNLRQFSFSRGTAAGSFLHKVLETWQEEAKRRWDKKITEEDKFLEKKKYINILRRRFGLSINSQVEEEINGELVDWIEKINNSKLISGANLNLIPKHQKACEMGFTLLANSYSFFPTQKINELFKKWGKNFALEKISTPIAFLRGEIDLCYQWKDKFYIVDYKSNHLGNRAEDYRPEKLALAMDEHGYWLQALIYQTALHRHLKNRLKNYEMAKHLAPVEYFFIRAAGVAKGEGHLKIEIPNEIVLIFDELISSPKE